MKNIWAAGALGTPPPAPSSPSTGYPTDGDPLSSVQPTYPGAYWFHQVTMEILNAITAAGLTPDQTTLTQLASAIALLGPVQSVNGRTGAVSGVVDTSSFTGANQSMAANGYQKLPGGLILQWMTVSVGDVASGGTSGTATLPISFPNNNFFSSCSPLDGVGGSGSISAMTISKTTSQVVWKLNEWTAGTQSASVLIFALGN
jgi:hypothetical protein